VTIDWRSVGAGAIAALVFVLPAAAVSAIAVENGSTSAPALLVITMGMLAGGFVAGSKRPDAPLTHGAVAAATAYVAAQVLTLLIKVAKGSDLRSPLVYVFNLLLMASIGVVGGFIAERRNARVIS